MFRVIELTLNPGPSGPQFWVSPPHKTSGVVGYVGTLPGFRV